MYYEDLKAVNENYFSEFKDFFNNFLNSGSYILGDLVSNFEEDFASYNSSEYSVGLSNGLDAIKLSLLALDLPPGSTVLVQAHTYIASMLPVLDLNFNLDIVDHDLETHCISIDSFNTIFKTINRNAMGF